MVIHRTLFGTDGVRGIANQHPMTSEVALRVGQAAARFFGRTDRRHGIVIGKDTRLSGYMIETALASGICSMGGDVLLVGPLPTPGVAYITRGMRAAAGVMISASHNPYQDNGIKFFDHKGYKLPDADEAEIERLMEHVGSEPERVSGDRIGKAARVDDAAGRYITFLKSTVPEGLVFDGMKVVVDCAHGAAYRVAPAVLSELGAHVIAINVTPDGRNINRACGSMHPEQLCRVVQEQSADCGFALDGDADRVIMCDAKGMIVDGDGVLAICALDLHTRGALRNKTVIATSMSNLGLELALRPHGIRVMRAEVGDRYVIEAMRAQGSNVGGEQSGHVIFADHSTTGDGTLAALQVLSVMQQRGKALAELHAVFAPMPQVLMNVRVRIKPPLEGVASVATLLGDYQRELGDRGRILVRYSGTEMLVRVMVEGENPDRIRAMADSVATELTQQLGVT